jgi:hypothetical protein
VSFYIITDDELGLLHEKPWSARLTYLMALKPFMDYETRIVGLRTGDQLSIHHGSSSGS